MKNLKKVLVCIALVCCLSIGSIGCSNDTNDNAQSDTSISDNAGANVGDSNNTQDNDTQETDADGNIVTNNSNNQVQETVALTDANGNVVTDADGNVVTQVVVNNGGNTTQAAQTDANGNEIPSNAVTDSKGNVVTETDASGNTVVVTDKNSSNNNNNNNSNNNDTTSNDDSIYFAKNRYSVFIWMSEDTSNKYDSGAMVEVAFKVLDDAPAGNYPVEFNYVELYSSDAEDNISEVPFTVQNGSITVGQETSVSEQGAASNGVNLRLDTATAKPGDVVKLKVYLDNNTGIAVSKIELNYDNKALEVQSISPAGVFSNEIIESNINRETSTKS